MSVIARRLCDVCSVEYSEENPGWMIMSAPNAPSDVTAEYDFCSWQCLETWVTSPDEEPKDEPVVTAADKQAKLDKAMDEMELKPPMSLANALASGALDFTRGPQ